MFEPAFHILCLKTSVTASPIGIRDSPDGLEGFHSALFTMVSYAKELFSCRPDGTFGLQVSFAHTAARPARTVQKSHWQARRMALSEDSTNPVAGVAQNVL